MGVSNMTTHNCIKSVSERINQARCVYGLAMYCDRGILTAIKIAWYTLTDKRAWEANW